VNQADTSRSKSVKTVLDPEQYGLIADEIQRSQKDSDKGEYKKGWIFAAKESRHHEDAELPLPLRCIDQIEPTECAAVGPKTAAGGTEKINSLDPPARSSMGPFFFGDSTQDARRAEFRPCKYCGKSFPREHRTGNACHGCASKFEGIVF
jgi:hypothetical protein